MITPLKILRSLLLGAAVFTAPPALAGLGGDTGGGGTETGECSSCGDKSSPEGGGEGEQNKNTCGIQHQEANKYVAWSSSVTESYGQQKTILGIFQTSADAYVGGKAAQSSADKAVIAPFNQDLGNSTMLKPKSGETLSECAKRALDGLIAEHGLINVDSQFVIRGQKADTVLAPY